MLAWSTEKVNTPATSVIETNEESKLGSLNVAVYVCVLTMQFTVVV